jgi:valyl-tRNA synthetase
LIGSLDLVTDGDSPPPPSARIDLSRGAIWIPLSGLFDLETEVLRLRGDLARLDEELRRSEGKLANEAFVSRASPAVVAAEREKAGRLSEQRERIRAQIAELGADA